MSLLQAASLLQDFDVLLVDQRLEEDWRRRLDEALAEAPVAVGITTLTGPMVVHALEMASYVKARSDVPIVWGGTHVTMLAEQTISSEAADYVVLGPGEEIFRDLVESLADKRPVGDLAGVWHKEDGRVQRNRKAPLRELADMPSTPYHLVDYGRYIYSHRNQRILDYVSSRGCPYSCTYCYNNTFHGGRWSARPASTVLADLAILKRRYAVDAVYFLDDNFFVDRARAWELIRGMPGLGLRYEIQGVDIQTIAAMDDEELDELEASGLLKITIGVESMNSDVRERIGKWGSPEMARTQLERLAGRRFLVMTSFIIGFPFETWAEIHETVGFATELQGMGDNFRLPQIYNFTPVKGTPIADALEASGFRFPDHLDDWREIDWDRNALFADNPDKVRVLEAIAFLSKFLDDKVADYGSRRFISALYRLYRPLARARLRRGLYGGLLEKAVYRRLKELV